MNFFGFEKQAGCVQGSSTRSNGVNVPCTNCNISSSPYLSQCEIPGTYLALNGPESAELRFSDFKLFRRVDLYLYLSHSWNMATSVESDLSCHDYALNVANPVISFNHSDKIETTHALSPIQGSANHVMVWINLSSFFVRVKSKDLSLANGEEVLQYIA